MEVSRYTTSIEGLICASLVLGMMVAFAFGRRAGIRHHQRDPEGARIVGGPIEASIFGLLGLLIAFTFSGAADRFDARRALITDEANAIGTAWMRLDLLAPADRDRLRDELRAYLDARLAFYSKLPNLQAATPDLERANTLQNAIWKDAVESAPRGTSGSLPLVLPPLNDMFDIASSRMAALTVHPPVPIYGLLIVLALVCAALAGHHASSSARHPLVLPAMFAAVSGLAIYVILDLEFPRAGLIRVEAADSVLRTLRAQMS